MPLHRRLPRPLLAALLALALFVVPTAAATIPEIRGPVTDETGVLAGDEAEIEQAIEELLQRQRVQLWVVFVPTTDDLSAQEFAAGVAAGNSLGVNDALLLVAIEDRTVFVFRPGQQTLALRGADTIDLSDVLPAFDLTVDGLFAMIRPERPRPNS